MARVAAMREADRRAAAALAQNGNYFAWMHAIAVVDGLGGPAAVRALGRRLRPVLRALPDDGMVAKEVLARRVHAVVWLSGVGLDAVARTPVLAIGLVAEVAACRSLARDARADLVRRLDAEARHDPGHTPCRDELRQQLRAARAPVEAWQRETDDWCFRSFDPRLGRDGQPNRLPGQAALNLVSRFRPEGSSVLAGCVGSGTVLDACEILGVENCVGFDLRLDPRVAHRHAGRFVAFDGTQADWSPVCPAGSAGLIVLTPPPHAFGTSVESDSLRDIGRTIDPEDWLAAVESMIAGATAALSVGGVLAIAVAATSEYDNGSPVPDLRTRVGALLAQAGLECFLGNPIASAGRPRAAAASGAWLYPSVIQIVVVRKT